jgi:putative DNA primase/helicase
MIEGCLGWQKKGLALPASMRENTEAYPREQDVVGRFIEEECITGEEFTSPKSLTYSAFKLWVMTPVEFNEKMLAKFGEGRSSAGRYWRGFKLKGSGLEATFPLADLSNMDGVM